MTHASLGHMLEAVARGPKPREHVLYKTGDPDCPRPILDRNDEVVLALCRVCDQAECELEPTCPGNQNWKQQGA